MLSEPYFEAFWYKTGFKISDQNLDGEGELVAPPPGSATAVWSWHYLAKWHQRGADIHGYSFSIKNQEQSYGPHWAVSLYRVTANRLFLFNFYFKVRILITKVNNWASKGTMLVLQLRTQGGGVGRLTPPPPPPPPPPFASVFCFVFAHLLVREVGH